MIFYIFLFSYYKLRLNLIFSIEIKASEFDATPMVLLIGQYSTGKTTFLNHLLGEDFPGMHIGPEPTTDKVSFALSVRAGCRAILHY